MVGHNAFSIESGNIISLTSLLGTCNITLHILQGGTCNFKGFNIYIYIYIKPSTFGGVESKVYLWLWFPLLTGNKILPKGLRDVIAIPFFPLLNGNPHTLGVVYRALTLATQDSML